MSESYEEIIEKSKKMTEDERQKRFTEFEDGDFTITPPEEDIAASFIKNFDAAADKRGRI